MKRRQPSLDARSVAKLPAPLEETSCEDCRDAAILTGAIWRWLRRRLFRSWKSGPLWSVGFAQVHGASVFLDFEARTVYLRTGQRFDDGELVHILAHAATWSHGHGPAWEAEMLRVASRLEREGDVEFSGNVLRDLKLQRGLPGSHGSVDFTQGVFQVVRSSHRALGTEPELPSLSTQSSERRATQGRNLRFHTRGPKTRNRDARQNTKEPFRTPVAGS